MLYMTYFLLEQELMRKFYNYEPESSEAVITHHPGFLRIDFSPTVEDFTIKQVWLQSNFFIVICFIEIPIQI